MKDQGTCIDKSEIVWAYALLHGRHLVLVELVECVHLQLSGINWPLLHGK